MTEAAAIVPAEPRSRRAVARVVLAGVTAFLLALGVAISCYAASGVTLGLFFGPLLLLTFLTPPLVMNGQTLSWRLSICAGLFFGVALVWAINVTAMEAGRASCVLAAYLLALAGGAALFERLRIGPVFAAALVVLLGIAWLTWPIWLVPWLTGANAQSIVQGLTIPHPLMALNAAVFERFNAWDRYKLTYQQLTTLNQDIFYTLPHSVLPMTMLHGVLGIAGLLLAEVSRRKARRHV